MCFETAAGPEDANLLSRVAEGLGHTETILFVEDEAFVREVTCEVLQSAGYRVLPAKDSAAAVMLYDQRAREVKLLLTDVVLPDESGPALAGRLRRQNPELKVLLITGNAHQIAVYEATTEEYLPKPFSTEGLLRKVRQVLDRVDLGIGEGIRENNPVTHACDNA